MNFVAIDFETATSAWTSICSIGICVVENNKIVEMKEMLIKPTPYEFNSFNVAIHGITPQMVKTKPVFSEVWDEIKPYVDGKTVVAHNASFDVGALRKTLEMFGLEFPTFEYLCTVKLSKKAYPDLPSHKLNILSDEFGIDFSHHNACQDAYACAEVLLHILKDFKLNTVEEIEKKFGIGAGKIYPGYEEPCRKRKKGN